MGKYTFPNHHPGMVGIPPRHGNCGDLHPLRRLTRQLKSSEFVGELSTEASPAAGFHGMFTGFDVSSVFFCAKKRWINQL